MKYLREYRDIVDDIYDEFYDLDDPETYEDEEEHNDEAADGNRDGITSDTQVASGSLANPEI